MFFIRLNQRIGNMDLPLFYDFNFASVRVSM